MARQFNQTQPKKSFPLIPALVVIAAIGILLTAGGFTFAASQESQDAFCASCHTQPETTFYARSTTAISTPVDNASFHRANQVRCIDCHSGQGVLGRVSAELMGARNAVKWYTGTAVQPAVMTYAIGDGNCLKCHADVVQRGFTPKEQITLATGRFEEREGRLSNHWHELMARWQAASASAQNCVSCHAGHVTGSTAQAGFMDGAAVQQVCDNCHQVLRREEGG